MPSPTTRWVWNTIRALGRCGSGAEIFTLPRRGDGHDAPLRDAEGFASGSAIRRLLAEGQRDAALSCMAAAMAEVYRKSRNPPAGRRSLPASASARCSPGSAPWNRRTLTGWTPGGRASGRRLYHASREAPSLEGVLAAAKTRRVAYARLRRMVLWAYLGLCPGEVPETVPYLRVLAAGARGRALLHRMRHTAAVPVLTKPADVRALPPAAQTLFGREAAAADLYALAYPDLNAAGGGFLWRQTPVML